MDIEDRDIESEMEWRDRNREREGEGRISCHLFPYSLFFSVIY